MTTAKVFMSGRSQAVRIPKDLRFDADEVYIRRVPEGLLLTPKRSQRLGDLLAEALDLLDTNICVYVIKTRPLEVLARFNDFEPQELAVSVVTAMELHIGAHALSLGATLVTNNEREFRRVAGLTVENWAA